jgi:hypothetical protein
MRLFTETEILSGIVCGDDSPETWPEARDLAVVVSAVTPLVQRAGIGPGHEEVKVVEFVVSEGVRGNYERSCDGFQSGFTIQSGYISTRVTGAKSESTHQQDGGGANFSTEPHFCGGD